MDTAQWEEFGFWNVQSEAAQQVYHQNIEDVGKERHDNKDPSPISKIGQKRKSRDMNQLEENEFSHSSSHSMIYDPQNLTTFQEREVPMSYQYQEDNRVYMDNEWGHVGNYYQNTEYNYGGIELDMLLFQILDLVHQSEGEGIPAQCIFVPNHLSLERLFEMRMQLGVTYETISFLEAMIDVFKHGIDQLIRLNSSVDGFCVKYLRELHSKNSNNKLMIDNNVTKKIEEPKTTTITGTNDDDVGGDDDTDSDYYDEGRKRPKRSSPKKSGESSSNRLSKSSKAMLRRWLEEHVDNPYPSDEEKRLFAERTNLSIKQINNWFINARRRDLPKIFSKLQEQE